MGNKQPRTVYRRHGDYLDVSGPIMVGLRQYFLGIQEAIWLSEETGILSHGWQDVWKNLSHPSNTELLCNLKGIYILKTMVDVQGLALQESYKPLFYYEKDDPNPLSLKTIRLLIRGHLINTPNSFIIDVAGDHRDVTDQEWATFAEIVGYTTPIRQVIRHDSDDKWFGITNTIPVTFLAIHEEKKKL